LSQPPSHEAASWAFAVGPRPANFGTGARRARWTGARAAKLRGRRRCCQLGSAPSRAGATRSPDTAVHMRLTVRPVSLQAGLAVVANPRHAATVPRDHRHGQVAIEAERGMRRLEGRVAWGRSWPRGPSIRMPHVAESVRRRLFNHVLVRVGGVAERPGPGRKPARALLLWISCAPRRGGGRILLGGRPHRRRREAPARGPILLSTPGTW